MDYMPNIINKFFHLVSYCTAKISKFSDLKIDVKKEQ